MQKKLHYFIVLITLLGQLNAQTTTASFSFESINREYIVHVPASYNATTPLPLLISLHGLGDNMTNFSGAGFHALAEAENFIVVTPQALDFAYAGFSIGAAWNSGVGAQIAILSSPIYPNENINDVGFISALIDSLSAQYNIDPERIYATGFSMGGFMSNRLAVELNDKIAAIASVSGTLGDNVDRNNNPCPIPVMHIHGTADATIDYNADYQNGGLYTIVGDSVNGLMNFWNSVNQTSTAVLHNPNYTNIGSQIVEEFYWKNGEDSSEVRLLKVNGGTHVWNSIYPSEIWNFLSSHKNQASCEITGITSTPNVAYTEVYPNPAQSNIFIAADLEIIKVSIYNTVGELVLESGQNYLNIESLSAGVYLVKIQSQEGYLQSRFIKK